MKHRKGFVSNSSSSSFIVLKKDSNLTPKERKEKTLEVYRKCYGDDLEERLEEWLQKDIDKYEENDQYVLLNERVEYGSEDTISQIIPSLLEKLGIENITFKWGE